MIRYVYREPRFERQMDALRRAGKKNAIAANKAEKIIHKLAQGWQMPFSQKSFEKPLNMEPHPPMVDDPFTYPIEEKYLRMIFFSLAFKLTTA